MYCIYTNLNEEQLEVVENPNDNILLIAGPGSGKTKVLVHKMAHILEKNSNETIGILGLTFTSEAAKKMRIDLCNVTSPKLLKYSFIGNFHQFGQVILRHYGHLCNISRNFEIIDEDKAEAVLIEVLNSIHASTKNSKRLLNNISRYRGKVNLPKPEELGEFSSKFVQILSSYEKTKRSYDYLDFDDLIILLIDLIKKIPALKEHFQDIYSYIFVDELQDTSLLQLELLKELFDPEKTKIFGVADEDQILYEWRDARVATIGEFEKTFKVEVKYLVKNYRSPQEILDVANTLISNNSNRHDKKLISMLKERRGEVILHVAESHSKECKFIADNIKQSLKGGNRLEDHVILARDGWMLNELKALLIDENLTFTHLGDKSIRQNEFVIFLRAVISSICSPGSNLEFLKASLEKLKRKGLLVMLNYDSLTEFLSEISNRSIDHFIIELCKFIGFNNYDIEEDTQKAVRISFNIIEMAIKEGARNYSDLSDALCLDWNRLEESVLNSEKSIKLMTIHKSKGLEFPIVYVLHMEDGMLPKIRKGFETNFAEERRLLFVAITRTMIKFVMSYSNYRVGPYGPYNLVPSRFLKEINNDNIHIL